MKRESWKKLWPFMKVEQETTTDLRIVGDRTVLRSKIMDDTEADYSWRIDPELAALDATRPVTLTFIEYMRYHRDDVSYPSPWSVRMAIDTLDGRHIGNCMYYDINNDKSQCEFGIMIGDREFWGRGYGTDVVKSALKHIFTSTQLERVYLHTLLDNLRAQKSFAKAGFRAVRNVKRDGYEFILMEVRQKDWAETHAATQATLQDDVLESATSSGSTSQAASSSQPGAPSPQQQPETDPLPGS
jgi:ribosomal-protein-alanine N-acetyltransferase